MYTHMSKAVNLCPVRGGVCACMCKCATPKLARCQIGMLPRSLAAFIHFGASLLGNRHLQAFAHVKQLELASVSEVHIIVDLDRIIYMTVIV